MTTHKVVRFQGKLCVAYTDTKDSEPVRYTGYWPISESRSIGASMLLDHAVEDGSGRGVFSLVMTQENVASGDYGMLQRFRAVLVDNGRTEAIHIDYEPVPCPKVRKGTPTRWARGRWEKELKAGWVAI